MRHCKNVYGNVILVQVNQIFITVVVGTIKAWLLKMSDKKEAKPNWGGETVFLYEYARKI